MRRVLSILAAALFSASLAAQASESNFEEPSNSEPNSMEATRFIGEYYGGGIVFHLEEGGQHGLVTNVIEEKHWHHGTFTDDYTVRDGIATAKFNKKRIQAIKDAKAQNFGFNEEEQLSKWYLPTRYDLNILYLNRAAIGGFTDFSKGWKSVEMSSINAWYHSFITGGSFTDGKDDTAYIRIIRKF